MLCLLYCLFKTSTNVCKYIRFLLLQGETSRVLMIQERRHHSTYMVHQKSGHATARKVGI